MVHSDGSFVFVSVGTDHHPFDRLIRWVDEWLLTDLGLRAACLMQSGASAHPRQAGWMPYLSQQGIQAAVKRATIVVGHAGPGTIIACRSRGLVPIVVPRRKALGEAVDDHQLGFAARMAQEGEVALAESPAALAKLLDLGTEDPSAFRLPRRSERVEETVHRFATLVEELVRKGRASEPVMPRLSADLPRSEG